MANISATATAIVTYGKDLLNFLVPPKPENPLTKIFQNAFKELDDDFIDFPISSETQNTTIWTGLMKIYERMIFKKHIKTGRIISNLSNEYETIAPHIPELIEKLDIPLSWLDSMIDPPEESFSFDKDRETKHIPMKAAL